jgi:hypothetical protein
MYLLSEMPLTATFVQACPLGRVASVAQPETMEVSAGESGAGRVDNQEFPASSRDMRG